MTCSVDLLNFFRFYRPMGLYGHFSSNFIFHTMSFNLQEAVQLGGYIFSDISTITKSLLQEQALQKIREIAVVSNPAYMPYHESERCFE